MPLSYTPSNNLLCKEYKIKERVLHSYRGFRLPAIKLIFEYSFSGFVLKIIQNNQHLRYDIFLRKEHIESGEKINLKEVEKFRFFYGKGFNIIIFSESDERQPD